MAGGGLEGGEAGCEGHVEEWRLREGVHGVVGLEEELGEVGVAVGAVQILQIIALVHLTHSFVRVSVNGLTARG